MLGAALVAKKACELGLEDSQAPVVAVPLRFLFEHIRTVYP